MRSALTVSLLAFPLLLSIPCLAQRIDPVSSAVCDATPKDLSAVRLRAEAGNAVAQYQLGAARLQPKPASDDAAAEALIWFQRSAEQGYPPAEYMLGNMHYGGGWQDRQQLVYWWTKAAEQGEVRAQMWLGAFYEQGREGIKRDYQKAVKWLTAAAKQGNPDAQATLGQMYEDGEGVPQNYNLAAHWYGKAAEHVPDLGGAGQGRNELGLLYLHGHGVEQDYVTAYMWFALIGNPTEEHMDFVGNPAEEHMTPMQIDEAQRRARERVHKHPERPVCGEIR